MGREIDWLVFFFSKMIHITNKGMFQKCDRRQKSLERETSGKYGSPPYPNNKCLTGLLLFKEERINLSLIQYGERN